MAPTTAAAAAPSFTRQQLAAWDLLLHPIWIFDVTQCSMWWVNSAALAVWKGTERAEVLRRDFKSDMSEATKRRLEVNLQRFKKGERFNEQWTYYPNGTTSKTVNITVSGIYIDDEDGSPPRLAMLNEGQKLEEVGEEIRDQGLRSVEMLRHLPVAVGLFDTKGNVLEQNPEAFALFGHLESSSSLNDASRDDSHDDCAFVKRFVDQEQGRRILEGTVDDTGDSPIFETQQRTASGPRWFAVQVLRRRDPVSADPVVLYSARDITQIVHAKEMEREAVVRSEFLSVMAHEIRTPLHQVSGFVELLAQSDLNEQQKEYVELLDSSALHMLSVINDVLDFSKLEAGKMSIESIPFDVKDVAHGCLAVVHEVVEKKGLRLVSNLDDVILPRVLGDPNRLRQILLNLLNNAVKFTHEGTITLTIRFNGDQKTDTGDRINLEFGVQDTGIGLSVQDKKAVFQKYVQASRNSGGTGLGLAICSSLVAAMDGSIDVDSELGHGSRFWFRLPFKLPSECTVELAPSGNGTRNHASEGPHLHVLVAEDNKMNQKLITSMLQRMGHEVVLVDDGQQAVQATVDEVFDIVLMDVQMPVLDGLEATVQIRERLSHAELPILGLTAEFRPSELEKYVNIGMNSCVGKPVRMKELKGSIEQTVQKAKSSSSCLCQGDHEHSGHPIDLESSQ